MTCSTCHYWTQMRDAMARIDATWKDKPSPAHSCPDKAKEN